MAETQEEQQEKFERELFWCIKQLEVALNDPKQKKDTRQVRDSTKVLKTLRSSKAAMVKKRQVMRATFGDYRKKMSQEEKQHAANMKQISLEVADKKKLEKCKFYRKALHNSPAVTTQQSSTECQNSSLCEVGTASSCLAAPSNNNFRFNFATDDSKESFADARGSDTPPQQENITSSVRGGAGDPPQSETPSTTCSASDERSVAASCSDVAGCRHTPVVCPSTTAISPKSSDNTCDSKDSSTRIAPSQDSTQNKTSRLYKHIPSDNSFRFNFNSR